MSNYMDNSGKEHECEFEGQNQQMWTENSLGLAVSVNRSLSLPAATTSLEHVADMHDVQTHEGGHISNLLHAAIKSRSLETIPLLIQCGADVNQPTTRDRSHTPLQYAVEVGDFDIVQQLLNYGARVDEPPACEAGETPLQLAATKGFLAIAWLLLENGADVNAVPSKVSCRTALEGASEQGRSEMAQLLINAGADIEGPRGLRHGLALQLAKDNRHFATLELLQFHLTRTTRQSPVDRFHLTPTSEQDSNDEDHSPLTHQRASPDLELLRNAQFWGFGDA